MKNILHLLVVVYCFICRIVFEMGSIVLVWVYMPNPWAIVITIVFALWYFFSFFLKKA